MYAEVILPTLKSLTATKTYTYSIPISLSNIQVGHLVLVPFGKEKKQAIVKAITKIKPAFPTKDIESIAYDQPLLNEKNIKLISASAAYYLATEHRFSKLFLPKQILSNKIEPTTSKEDNKIPSSSFLKKLAKSKSAKIHEPTNEQEQIISDILKDCLNMEAKTHLIWGATGSGKTEIYRQLISKLPTIKQSLILVPEISLTPQFAQYFYDLFPDEIVVWHSELNETEKKNAWWQIKTNQARIVIGSRSALFLPFNDLNLIIIDEEHATAFKQNQDPRYHARTIAQFASQIYSCPLILGTATPSMEVYHSWTKGKIAYHRIHKRIHDTPQPTITVVDMKEEIKKGNFSIISEKLQSAIQTTLNNNRQVLLFLNRRGYAASIQCFDCGHIANCTHCDISLTLHNSKGKPFLQCHLCSQTYPNINRCPNCHNPRVKNIGLGTQQVESTIQELFPSAKILRADKDTTTTKHSFSEIYKSFANHEADILIGTQMISKGLHLPKVDLVGVVLADIGLSVPDFRTNELAFQTLKQVCGRAGRSKIQGQVIIQTLAPNHQIFAALPESNLEEFYATELIVRQKHNYPPFSKVIKLTHVHKDESTCLKIATEIESKLTQLGVTYLAAPALIFRQSNNYHYNILIFSTNPEPILDRLNLTPNWRIDRDPLEVV